GSGALARPRRHARAAENTSDVIVSDNATFHAQACGDPGPPHRDRRVLGDLTGGASPASKRCASMETKALSGGADRTTVVRTSGGEMSHPLGRLGAGAVIAVLALTACSSSNKSSGTSTTTADQTPTTAKGSKPAPSTTVSKGDST